MNVLDSQLVRGQLLGLGYRFIDDWQQADVVLYNTCSVREHAEQKVYSRLGEVAQHKRQTRSDMVVGVLGCMAEREGVDLARRFAAVDLMCGPGELDKVPMLIDNAVKTRLGLSRMDDTLAALQGNTHRRSSTLGAAEDQLEMLDLSRSFSPDEFSGAAYVRITRGCNKFCTYCVVPNTRGAEVHRPPNNIVEECKRLVDAGVVEITLLGQTVNHYHFNHGAAVLVNGSEQPQIGEAVTGMEAGGLKSSRLTTFADLLARIHDEVPGLARLRFVTSFPRDFGDDILHVIREKPRLCRYLHLPVQSGSNRILKLMNRGYSLEQYWQLLHRVRDILPDATVASDLICGFPTETEEDHHLTCQLLREARFKNCFIFKYSPRPGTAAIDRFPDDVPDETKRRRNNELLAIQQINSDALHQSYVGKTVRVFVESISRKALKEQQTGNGQSVYLGWEKPTTQLSGRTDGDLIVMFDGDPSLVGKVVDVRISHAATLALFGSPVDMHVPMRSETS
jgi:tRNA-2-methylthio-N6-dimethylallyladenosine synthase